MVIYLNGEKLLDTSETGNQKFPLSIDNHLAQARLKAGRNILAVKMITGKASSVLTLGDRDLRKLVTRIKMSGIRWVENFDSDTVACSGNPELIQGHPTPGLLSVTGQGVFRTPAQIHIIPPEQKFPFPSNDKQYLATSIRIQNFGREENARYNSELDVFFKADDATEFRFRLQHQADKELLLLKTVADSPEAREISIPCKILPADFIFAATAAGDYAVAVNSLADSSSRVFRGENAFFRVHREFNTGLVFRSTTQKEAEIVVDNS
jgi:hypothetical protein